MATTKKLVGGWRLTKTEPGLYEYETKHGPMTYRVSILDDAGQWRVIASGFKHDKSAKHVAVAEDLRRFGGVMGEAESFQDAKNKAYQFMRKMPAGRISYNGLLDTASKAGWD